MTGSKFQNEYSKYLQTNTQPNIISYLRMWYRITMWFAAAFDSVKQLLIKQNGTKLYTRSTEIFHIETSDARFSN